MDIGSKINKLRTERKLSMRELGDRIGVSHAHISKLESGINSPSVDLLEKLADCFNINIAYFFTSEREKKTFNENELELLHENDLSKEILKEKYYFEEIDGKPVTDEELDEMIKWVKMYRLMKQNESS